MGTALKAGAVGAAAGVVALGGFLASSVKEAMESQKVIAQLDAVLKSTGGTAGLTSKQIQDMASAFQKQTVFGDEAILSAQNLLLTFTQIKGPQFEGATQAVLDMATAMGTDLNTAAIQVGKALNDPIQGVTALRRVGVQLTDQQEAQIKTLMELGDVTGAQKVILGELTTQFGGSAAAAADTFGGRMQQLKNQIGEFQERVGMALLPLLTKLVGFLAQNLPVAIAAGERAFAALRAEIEKPGFQAFIAALKADVLPVLKDFGSFLQNDVLPQLIDFERMQIELYIAVAKFLAPALVTLKEGWQDIEPVVKRVLEVLRPVGQFLLDHKEILVGLAAAILLITNPWLVVVAVLAVVLAKWDDIKKMLVETIPAAIDSVIHKIEGIPVIGDIFRDTLNMIEALTEAWVQGLIIQVQFLFESFTNAFNFWKAVFTGDWAGAWNAIKAQFETTVNALSGIFGVALDAIKGILSSKLTMLAGIGSDIGNALARGLEAAMVTSLNWVIDQINTIIRAYNTIPVAPNIGTIGAIGSRSGGNLGPSPRGQGLDRFDSGGIVPGPMGAPRLAIVHGGEEVRTPAQQQGGGLSMDYDRLAAAVSRSISGLTVVMDGREVGRLVSAQIGADSFLRARGG
jgi:hypothetical protein